MSARPDAPVPDYRRGAIRALRGPDTLAHAIAELTRERIGAQKDVAAKLGVSIAYVSALLSGKRSLPCAQLNRILDACRASDEERFAFNGWGAREAGWKI